MQSTIQLIDLLGAAALLFWGLRLIKTGVMRAFGPMLRQWIAKGTKNRVQAAFSGFVATLLLQSSTATAVIASSFAGKNLLSPRMGQAVMLGANVGTAIATIILSMNVHWLASVFIFLGVFIFSNRQSTVGKGVGRAIIGLGLMLLALQLMSAVTEPLRHSPIIATILSALDDAPLFALIFAAGLAILGSSSLAVVIFVMLLAKAGIITPALSLALVAGANVGGAVPPLLAVTGEGLEARRLAFSNLLVRAFGAIALLIAAKPLADFFMQYISDPAQLPIYAHLFFNIALLVIFLPLITPVGRLTELLMPRTAENDETAPSYLDDNLLDVPSMALALAARETLRVGDLVNQMLEKSLEAFRTGGTEACRQIADLEAEVDQRHETIKMYVARIDRTQLDAAENLRAQEILNYVINLEHSGDIIAAGLSEIALKKSRNRLNFSREGLAELTDFYEKTAENLRMAQAIFLSRDEALARQLVVAKTAIRNVETTSAERHLDRVRAGNTAAIETSSLHMDILRDLKRVNAHLASVAYPLLKESGSLRESRLRVVKEKTADVHG
ncbi:Na/Pi cotransporter family protein [Brucellaceae bacterium C25G]